MTTFTVCVVCVNVFLLTIKSDETVPFLPPSAEAARDADVAAPLPLRSLTHARRRSG